MLDTGFALLRKDMKFLDTPIGLFVSSYEPKVHEITDWQVIKADDYVLLLFTIERKDSIFFCKVRVNGEVDTEKLTVENFKNKLIYETNKVSTDKTEYKLEARFFLRKETK